MANRTLNDLFREADNKFPARNALSFFGRKVIYARLAQEDQKFASFLRVEGLKVGDRVLMLLPSCPQMVIAYRGILKAGCVVAALNPMLKPEELVPLVRQARPKLFVALNSYKLYWHNLAIARALPEDCRIVLVDLPDYMPKSLGRKFKILNCVLLFFKKLYSLIFSFRTFRANLSWDTAQKLGSRYYCPHYTFEDLPDPDDLAVLQFTGGTTGIPKAVALTHANLVANAEQAIAAVGNVINEESVVLSVIPCFHVYGLSVCLNISLWRGSEVVLVPKFHAKEAFELIEKEKITIFPALPRIFSAMVDHPDFKSAKLSSLKLCVSGSGALDGGVKKQFEEAVGCEIIEGYGLSETSPLVSINPPGNARPGSLGKLVKDTEMRIVDGELWLRGPQVMSGYWENKEETDLVLTSDGWLKTGDMVEERDGYLWLTDRKKDMIKIKGENVYPSEIEQILKDKLNLVEVYVVGVPDRKQGERVVAFLVILAGGPSYSLVDVQRACSGLSSVKIPSSVLCLHEGQVPRTYLGKVQKKDLRAMLNKGST